MKAFRWLLSRFSSLIQFILILWVAMFSVTCGYDAQARTRSACDAVVGAPCNYDAATTLEDRGRSSTPQEEVGSFTQCARFVAPNSVVNWNNGWRTANGKFASPQGPGLAGADAEQAVWNTIAQKPGWNFSKARRYSFTTTKRGT
jgi:hypothetical protein